MARRRSTKRATTHTLSQRWSAFRPALIAGGWAVALLGAMAALAVGVPALRAQAMTTHSDSPLRVRFENRPAWMTDGELSPLADLVANQLSASPMDRSGLARVQEALQETGWFQEISQVRRSGMDDVTVHAEWTVPFAVVRDGGYDHLVDSEARLLPRCYRPGTAPRGFIRIEGVSTPRPTRYGTRWPGEDIKSAMALARLIDERPWRSQVAWIDLSSMPMDGCLRMKTFRDCTVKWGRAPGQEGAAEVPARQKLDYLGWLHDHYGRIDSGCEEQLDLLSDYVGAR